MNRWHKYFSYFKCSKAHSHFCTGSLKRLPNGQTIVLKPHNHDHCVNENLIDNFREVLKHRASTENGLLKNLYDKEARR